MEYHIECPDKNFDLVLKEYKEIPLTQSKVALVDEEDYEYLNQFKWCAAKYRNNAFYAVRIGKKDGKWITILMHKKIMENFKDKCIDHINCDGLDNRKTNLRMCNYNQNQMNRGKQINNTSGYKGVYWHKPTGKWQVIIGVNCKLIHLGYFFSKEEAAKAYNEAVSKYHGEFANLNEIF